MTVRAFPFYPSTMDLSKDLNAFFTKTRSLALGSVDANAIQNEALYHFFIPRRDPADFSLDPKRSALDGGGLAGQRHTVH